MAKLIRYSFYAQAFALMCTENIHKMRGAAQVRKERNYEKKKTVIIDVNGNGCVVFLRLCRY